MFYQLSVIITYHYWIVNVYSLIIYELIWILSVNTVIFSFRPIIVYNGCSHLYFIILSTSCAQPSVNKYVCHEFSFNWLLSFFFLCNWTFIPKNILFVDPITYFFTVYVFSLDIQTNDCQNCSLLKYISICIDRYRNYNNL